MLRVFSNSWIHSAYSACTSSNFLCSSVNAYINIKNKHHKNPKPWSIFLIIFMFNYTDWPLDISLSTLCKKSGSGTDCCFFCLTKTKASSISEKSIALSWKFIRSFNSTQNLLQVSMQSENTFIWSYLSEELHLFLKIIILLFKLIMLQLHFPELCLQLFMGLCKQISPNFVSVWNVLC